MSCRREWCRHCVYTDVAWSESRPMKRMSGPREAEDAEAKTGEAEAEGATVYRYACNACGRRFTDRPGFEGRHYTEGVILFALMPISRNMLPQDAADTIREEKRAGVSSRTIQRWADHYPRLVEALSKNLEIEGGNAVSVDEKHYKSKDGARWMARAMCMATRLILAGDHRPDKLNYDATCFLEKVVERLGALPLPLLSDRLRGYREGHKSAMRTEPKPATIHVPDAAINNKHVNNNRHERHNADTERRKKDSARIQLRRPGAVRAR